MACGTASNSCDHSWMVAELIFPKRWKLPKVRRPVSSAGNGPTAGAPACGLKAHRSGKYASFSANIRSN